MYNDCMYVNIVIYVVIYFSWKGKWYDRRKYKIIVLVVYLKSMKYKMFIDEIYVFFRFLTGTISGLRLGCTMMDKRNLFVEPWKKFTQVYQKLRNKDTVVSFDIWLDSFSAQLFWRSNKCFPGIVQWFNQLYVNDHAICWKIERKIRKTSSYSTISSKYFGLHATTVRGG